MDVAGAEVLVAETIRALRDHIEATVFCLDAVGSIGRQLQAEGIDVISFGRRSGCDLRIAWRMARQVRKRGIEVLHAHQYTPFFYSALARGVSGNACRVIFTEHGRHSPDIVSARRQWANRLFLSRMADEVNAVCAFSATSLRVKDGFAGHEIDVIENGIELKRYRLADDWASLRRSRGLVPGRRYVVDVARMHRLKDQSTLLRVLRGGTSSR